MFHDSDRVTDKKSESNGLNDQAMNRQEAEREPGSLQPPDLETMIRFSARYEARTGMIRSVTRCLVRGQRQQADRALREQTTPRKGRSNPILRHRFPAVIQLRRVTHVVGAHEWSIRPVGPSGLL